LSNIFGIELHEFINSMYLESKSHLARLIEIAYYVRIIKTKRDLKLDPRNTDVTHNNQNINVGIAKTFVVYKSLKCSVML
jgi:adenylate cyclase